MKKTPQCFAGIAILFVILNVGKSQSSYGQEPGQAKTSTFMRLKLEPTKAVLEGIALADYEMITKNAGTIRNLMLDENWMVMQTEDYRRQSEEFRKSVEQLRDAASNKNIDGAMLAYVQMTIRCVQCHKTLRK
ncbi:MAG: hypothetical protein SGI77_01145 [Pirellulaceae bacterium]|nr:hypothetical protein [Pirellulaceae bacterium]